MSLEANAIPISRPIIPTLQLVNPNDDVVNGITNESNDNDIVIQPSPVPDHIAERPGSPITVMFDDTETESEQAGMSANDTVAEDTVAEDTVAEDTVAEDTVAEDTVAEDTVAEDTVAEDTVAEDTVAEDTVAEDTVAEDTVAEDTVAEDTVAEDTVAEDTVAGLVDEKKSLLQNTNVSIASDSIKKGLLEEFDTMWSNSVTPLNKSAMMKIVVRAMELVEKTDIKGQEQQDVVIDVLVEILESDIVVSVHKDSLVAFLKEDAGDVISLLVDASKGKININRLENIATRLFKKFGKCFAS
jgi:hypothetical protein